MRMYRCSQTPMQGWTMSSNAPYVSRGSLQMQTNGSRSCHHVVDNRACIGRDPTVVSQPKLPPGNLHL